MSGEELDWLLLQPNIETIIKDSVTKRRISGLNQIQSLVLENKIPKSDLNPLYLVFLKTYNYYQDTNSRNALLKTLEVVIDHDSNYLNVLIKFADLQVGKGKLAITSYLSILNWLNFFMSRVQDLPSFFKVHSKVLNHVIGYSYNYDKESHSEHTQHRRRIYKSAITTTRTGLVQIINLDNVESVIEVVLTLNANEAIIYFGIINDALKEQVLGMSMPLKSKIVDFFNNQVLLNKVCPEVYSLNIFGSYITDNLLLEDFNLILPYIEKAILKSSENSLGTIVPNILKYFDASLGDAIADSKLLTSLLNGIKSQNKNVHVGSVQTLTLLAPTFLDKVEKFIQEIFKTYKSTSNTELKSSTISILLSLNISNEIIINILNQILPIISKDQNEISLQALVHVFIYYTYQLSETDKAAYLKQIKQGLSDPKFNLRRIWFINLGEVMLKDESIFSDDFSAIFTKTLLEVQQSPLPSIANKGITCAYVAIYFLLKFNGSIDKSVLLNGNGEKPSILVNQKVYSKLVNDLDFQWLMKSLESVVEEEVDESYSTSWLYLAISDNVPYKSRIQAIESLNNILSTHAKLSKPFIDSITSILLSNNELSFTYTRLTPILTALGAVKSYDQTKSNLSKLLVISNHESLKIKDSWVGLIQRSLHKIDIGELVAENYSSILNSIYQDLSACKDLKMRKAILKSIGTLNFIQPELVAPIITENIKVDLSLSNFDFIDSISLKIWKAEEGEVVVDVLNNGKVKQEDKNSRDYETRKWEEELKQELAKKKAPVRKLTKDEQLAVNEQLAKESSIRKEVQSVVDNTIKAIEVIEELVENAKQVENGIKTWFPVAVDSLLDLIKQGQSFNLFKVQPIEAFLSLSSLISSRLGPLKKFIGVAILRLYSVSGLPNKYSDEPLLSLIGRLLFRVKILSDSAPLDSISLSYILTLLIKVLSHGKVIAIKNSCKQAVTSEFVEEDPEEEQLLLAIGIISSHAEAFKDVSIPRVEILEVLISLMKLPSKAKLSKDCFISMCQYIAITPTKKDLKIILDNIITPESFVRTAILEAIDSEYDLTDEFNYSNEIWIAAHDNDHNSAQIASTIWQDNDLKVVEDSPIQLLNFFGNNDSGLRLSVSKATVASIESLGKPASVFLAELIEFYHKKENPPPPKLDRFGLPIKSATDSKDPWEERSTVALTLILLTPHLSQSDIELVFKFLVNDKALGDKEDLVRQELLEAGVEIVKVHGASCIESLIPIFEASLSAKDDGTKIQDYIKESAIILYGALARHLDSSDDRLLKIVERLIKTLDTPSEDVQYAISECISPLVNKIDKKLSEYVDRLFTTLFEGKSLAVRRGAAYGISGLVKGVGIKALSDFDIIRTLSDAADDKKNAQRRESVSFAFECLSTSLGRYFEPYVIEVLPIILKSLGDSSTEVREATDAAAKQIMKNTTSFGVKRLIPVAIANLDEIAWRSKRGSVELLGSMAYLDPIQLSASLSAIVPEIVGVMNDTHKEVRKSADQALKRFGEVIRNPEIQAIVPILINAIADPTKHTDEALDKLIKTQFVHYIDGPSLALIIHVIHRGMKDRSAATKKKACQIVGNMAILVDAKDLQPYLSELVEELEQAMVDPVPATRSTAARALGSLVEKLGEDKFPDLIPRLLNTLQDESKSGDRLGSAQALAEVICGLGINKLEELFPSILTNATSSRNYICAGYMPLLLYLPVCFGSQFAPYLSRIIPPILNGLAKSDEEIRDVSLRAGRLIVKNYANKAVDLLLPELEKGLSDDSYRIRLSSVELTGDLLFQITGISGKNELEEEQADFTGGDITNNLIEVLGEERRSRILAALFVCRSDVAGVVRQASVDIWKALVANTARTVKEILPALTSIVIRKLASLEESQRTIAAQTLGEMVRRVGANALQQLLPTLEESMSTSDSDAKQGICIALTELISSTQSDLLDKYHSVFIKIIREGLVDLSPKVREAAAQAFEAALEELGKVVIDEIIPHLLIMLESDNSESALLALQDIMATKADVIFPILIPTLLAPPMDVFKAKALASLASVAGSALYRRLPLVLNTLVDAVIISQLETEKEQEEIKSAFDNVLLAIDDDDGVHPLMQQLLALLKHEDSVKRVVIFNRLGNFFANTTLDISVYLQDMIERLVLSLGDRSMDIVQGAFDGLTALVKRQPKDQLEKLVKPTFQALELTGVKGEDLAAFTLPRGPNAILPIFLHGLMYGNGEQKQLSALAIAEIVDKTPAVNLKPFATAITGPLIRVIGEKVNSEVKAGILIALNNLLIKIPQFLRPFIPQLQRTFVRSLSDADNDTLRLRAVKALGTLIEFQPRVDSLVTELVTGAKAATDSGVKTATLKAMLVVVDKAGKNMNEVSKTSILSLVESEITVVDDKSAVSYARLIGSIAKSLSTSEASDIIKNKILNKSNNDKFCILAINSFLKYSPTHIFNSGLIAEIIEFIIASSDSTNVYVSDNATLAIGKVLLLVGEKKSPVVKKVVEADSPFELDDENVSNLTKQLSLISVKPNSNSPDTRRLSLVVIRTVARLKADLLRLYLDDLVPSIFVCIRDPVIPIKLAAEKAYIAIFDLVDDVKQTIFYNWFEGKQEFTSVTGTKIVARSIGDYTKRVASRLATVERERITAGGDEETMFSDRFEDEAEVWAVGGIEISKI